jgi:hypothetical protein
LSQKIKIKTHELTSGRYELLFDCSNCGKFKFINHEGIPYYGDWIKSGVILIPKPTFFDTSTIHDVSPGTIVEPRTHLRVIPSDLWYAICNYENGKTYNQFEIYQTLIHSVDARMFNINVTSIIINYIVNIGIVFN